MLKVLDYYSLVNIKKHQKYLIIIYKSHRINKIINISMLFIQNVLPYIFILNQLIIYILQQFDQVIDQIQTLELILFKIIIYTISNCPQEVYRLKGDTLFCQNLNQSLFQCKLYDEALLAYKKQYQSLFVDKGIEIAYYHLCQQLNYIYIYSNKIQKIGMFEKAQNYLKNTQLIDLIINDGIIQQYNQMIVVNMDLVPKTMLQFIL